MAKRQVKTGQAMAEIVERRRRAALRQRSRAIAAAPAKRVRRVAPIDPKIVRAAGPKGIATLIAEGDSWFDYLWFDILDTLEDEYGYDVESTARAGDRVENMAYDQGELTKFRKALEKIVRRQELPKAVLLSGGGNDVAGEQFFMLLDHAASPAPGLNEDVVRGVVDVRVRDAYLVLIAAVTKLCETTTGQTIPIVVHGYDRSVPDGRGFGDPLPVPGLPGPWLRPGFTLKGFSSDSGNKAIVGDLIDRFNRMMKGVAAHFPHVRYVDLRGTLPNGANYRDWWANELHPTKRGFQAVAARFAAAIGR
jgi:hypothetical protein